MAAIDLREFWTVAACVVCALAAFYLVKLVLRVRRLQRAIREVKRRTSLQCVHCGYDLRVAGELCPECGELTPQEWAEAREIAGERLEMR